MSALTRFFFRNEVSCRSTAEVIGWWESRRFLYNVAVGSAGIVTLAGVQLILWLPPLSTPIPLIPSVSRHPGQSPSGEESLEYSAPHREQRFAPAVSVMTTDY